MANGTVTYQGYPTSSMQVISGQTTNIMNLSLSSGLAPAGATLTGATLTLSASVSSRAVGFSPMLYNSSSGYYESLASSCVFSATGTRTESFELGIPSAIAQTMAFTGGTQSFRFSGNSGASGLIICTLSTSNQVSIVISYQLPDACGAPTSASVSPTVVESDPTLSFSGAKAGTSNTITGYEIQYAESSNGSSYGSWTALKTISSTATSGSTTVGMPSTRGYYRKYRIRTQGSAGASYYSGWTETNVIRRNTIPLGPTSVVAAPSTFVDEQITIQWSGASSTTSSIKGFMIARKNSTDGLTFDSSWTVIASLTLAQSSGSYTYSYAPTLGTYIKYGVWSIDSLDVYSGETVSNTIQRVAPTACTPPTYVTLTPAIVEAALSLAWSGGGSSAGNSITGYTLQLSESTDGTTWSNWQAFAVVDSTSTSGSFSNINSPAIRGAYRKLRVQTRGSAGSPLYSAWAESNPARRNILPTPPTTFTASPETYYNTKILVTWSGTVLGTSNIKNYVLQVSTSSDGNNWSGWSALATVTSSATSGSYSVTPSSVDGMRSRYRIAVTDSLDALSAYVTSNTIQRMNRPETPIVAAPRNFSTIYNTTPRFLIKTGGTPDGRTQRIIVIINGTSYNSIINASMFSVSGSLANGVATIFKAPTQTLGNKTITIRCENDAGASAEETRSITIAALTVEDVVPGVTMVKAAHMQSLRDAANSVRLYYGLSASIWQEVIVAKRTQVRDWPLHIKELRTALDAVIVTINSFDTVAAFNVPLVNWIVFSPGSPRAAVMQQVITLISNL